MNGMTDNVSRLEMAFARPNGGSSHAPPRFAGRPMCACCGHARPLGRPAVIDVWPGGLSGLIAHGRYRLRQIRSQGMRRGGQALADLACVCLLSVGAFCVVVLLASPS